MCNRPSEKTVWFIGLMYRNAFFPLLQKYEEIRKSLEQCSIEKDVDFFVNLRRTGSLAPGESSVQSHKLVLTSSWFSRSCCSEQHHLDAKTVDFATSLLCFTGMQHHSLPVPEDNLPFL